MPEFSNAIVRHVCMSMCLCTATALTNHIDSTNSRSSAVSSKRNPLSPTEVAMDAWNPMESHFLSNWNLYKENTCNDSKGKTHTMLQTEHLNVLQDHSHTEQGEINKV